MGMEGRQCSPLDVLQPSVSLEGAGGETTARQEIFRRILFFGGAQSSVPLLAMCTMSCLPANET